MIDWVLTARLAGAIAATSVLALVLGALALAFGLRRLRREALADAARTRSGLDALGAELSQLASANLALREYLKVLSERVELSQQAAVAQVQPATGRAYELAARMAAGGAQSGELIANCGLTRAEAELAVLVHGSRNRAAAAH